MDPQHSLVLAAAACFAVTLAAIACAATALHRALAPVLAEVFARNAPLAAAVNRFMVIALCLYNFGYSANSLRSIHCWFESERPYPLNQAFDDSVRMLSDSVIAVGASAFVAFLVVALMRRRVELR